LARWGIARPRTPPLLARLFALLLVPLLAGCGAAAAARSGSGTSTTPTTSTTSTTSPAGTWVPYAPTGTTGSSVPGSGSTTTSTSTTTSVPPASGTTPEPAPAYLATVSTVDAAQLPYTWRPGCPVGPAQLRMLHLGYFGFDGRQHVGTMVVAAAVVGQVIAVFRRLDAERFPIRTMVPEDAFHGKDPDSMAADNTSGFNCRYAVAPGPPQWSAHAYGEAVDVDPVENPYLEGGQVQPPDGAPYVNRSDLRPGMAYQGGELVEAFSSVGWYWGGRWTSSPDYQHFSATGG
jgi:hypothetical protein